MGSHADSRRKKPEVPRPQLTVFCGFSVPPPHHTAGCELIGAVLVAGRHGRCCLSPCPSRGALPRRGSHRTCWALCRGSGAGTGDLTRSWLWHDHAERVRNQLLNGFPRSKWKWKLARGQPGWREVEREGAREGDPVKPGKCSMQPGEAVVCARDSHEPPSAHSCTVTAGCFAVGCPT